MSRLSRVQGGTAGLIAALLCGRVDPLSGEVLDRLRRWPDGRRRWYLAARIEREERCAAQKAERREMGRAALAIPDLADAAPF